jgi:hypothetical protein
VRGICTDGRHVSLVLGVAGSGKTTAIRCVAEAYTAAGYQVIGTATSGQAARVAGGKAASFVDRGVRRFTATVEGIYSRTATAARNQGNKLTSAARRTRGWASSAANKATRAWDNTGGRAVAAVANVCVDRGRDDQCSSYVERHPEMAQAVVDFAGGVLDVNPITAFLPLDLEGNGVNTKSGWYRGGQLAMAIPDIVTGAKALMAAPKLIKAAPAALKAAPQALKGAKSFIRTRIAARGADDFAEAVAPRAEAGGRGLISRLRTRVDLSERGSIGLGGSEAGGPLLAQTRGARMTTPQATELAEYLGFTRVKGFSHGQAVYTDGKGSVRSTV